MFQPIAVFLKRIVVAASLSLVVCQHAVYAVVLTDLYQANVSVSSQSENEQSKANQQGLKQVLIKVSGGNDALNDGFIKGKIRNPESLISSFRYQINQGQLTYQIYFDKQKVDALLRNAGFPIWDSRRPDTLMWLAIDKGDGDKSLLSESQASQLKPAIEGPAQSRGIRIALPIMDLQDLQQVSVYDVWGQFSQPVLTASERYGTNAVAFARLYFAEDFLAPQIDTQVDEDPSADTTEATTTLNEKASTEAVSRWYLEWNLFVNGETLTGRDSDDSQQALISRWTNVIADKLAAIYAVSSSAEQTSTSLDITVDKVNNLQAYVAVSEFLRSLSAVSSATLVAQKGAVATYRLQLLGSAEDVLNTLQLDDRIRQQRDEFGQPINPLMFTWAQ